MAAFQRPARRWAAVPFPHRTGRHLPTDERENALGGGLRRLPPPLLAGTPSAALPLPPGGARLRAPYDPVVPKSTGERWMGVPEAADYLGIMRRKVTRR